MLVSQALQPTTDDALAAAGDALAEHLIGMGLNVQVSRRLIMLIHPWDVVQDETEWREWLAGTDRFGMLVANHLEPAQAPLVQPTHSWNLTP